MSSNDNNRPGVIPCDSDNCSNFYVDNLPPSSPANQRKNEKTETVHNENARRASTENEVEFTAERQIITFNGQDLPYVVLRKIVEFLSSTERGRCKLVCRHWRYVCSVLEPKERLCISNVYADDLDIVFETLKKSSRSCFNLEFYGINFKEKYRKPFWEACGPRIRSLKLINCRLTNPPLVYILSYCRNLRELDFYVEGVKNAKFGLNIECPSTSTSDHSLQSLKIHFRGHRGFKDLSIWINKCDSLIDLFPNVVNFSLHHYNILHRERRLPLKLTGIDFSTSIIKQLYKSADTKMITKNFVRDTFKKKFGINFLSRLTRFNWTSLKDVEQSTKITEIIAPENNMKLVPKKIPQEIVPRPIDSQKITIISTRKEEDDKIGNLMVSLLGMRSLRHLRVMLHKNEISWKSEWSKLLSASNLETLRIVCNGFSSAKSELQYPIVPKLIDFAIDVEKDLDIELLLRSFPKLEELRLSHVDTDLLEFICANQRKLQSFKIDFARNLPISSNCINQLRQLKELEIPETFALQPHGFQNLKYLHIREGEHYYVPPDTNSQQTDKSSDSNYFTLKILQTFISKCPSLEVICCNSCVFNERAFDEFKNQGRNYAECPSPKVICCNRCVFNEKAFDEFKNQGGNYAECPSPEVICCNCCVFNKKAFDEFKNQGRNYAECPSPEVICCDCCVFNKKRRNYDDWFTDKLSSMVSKLKNLKFLYIKSDKMKLAAKTKMKNMEKIFEICPSLRVLIYRDKFVRNSISNRISKSKRSKVELLRMYADVDEEWNCQRYHSSEFFDEDT